MFPFYDLFGGNDGYNYPQRQRRNQQYDEDESQSGSDYYNNQRQQYYPGYSMFDPYGYQAAQQREQARRQKRQQEEQYRKMLEENERRKQEAAYQAYMKEQQRQQREYEKQMRRRMEEEQRRKAAIALEQQRQAELARQKEIERQKAQYEQYQQQLAQQQQQQKKRNQTLYDYFMNSKPSNTDEEQQVDENQIHYDQQDDDQQSIEQPSEYQQQQQQRHVPQPDAQQQKATADPQREKCDMSVLKTSQHPPTYMGQDAAHSIEFQTYDNQAVQQPSSHKMKSLDYESAQHMTQDVNNCYITIEDCKDGDIPEVEAYGGNKSLLVVTYKRIIDDAEKQVQLQYKLPANYDRTDIQATRTDKNTFVITVPHQTTDDKLIINFDNCGYKTQTVQTEVKESQTEKTNSSILDN